MATTEQIRYEDLVLQRGEQLGLEKGKQLGREEGREEGSLSSTRDLTLVLVEDRFGPLPVEIRSRIESETRLHALRAAFRASTQGSTLEGVLSVLDASLV